MYVTVKDKRVFAATGGKAYDNSLPTIVFLHGSGLDHTFWGLHSRFFAYRRYAVLVPDLPGHSHSDGPVLDNIEAMAEWLHDLLHSVGARDISLVAHSQGCLIALEYASRYPQKMKSVSLLASGLATPVNDALIAAANSKPRVAVDMMLSWGFGDAGHLHQGAVPGHSMLASGKKVMLSNPDGLAADLHACNNYRNGKIAAAAIRCSQQVIVASKDRMAPRKASSELINYLSDPTVSEISNSGHMVPQEAPDESRVLLRDFIFAKNPTIHASNHT